MPFCGDGVVDADEECDEGAAMPTATCRENCVVPICKFGLIVRIDLVVLRYDTLLTLHSLFLWIYRR